MSGPTNEAGLVNRIVKAIHAEYPDAWVFKVHGGPMQMSGVPDLLICIDGLLIGAEVKFQRPGESEEHARDRTTTGQRLQIGKIIKAGGMAGTVITEDEAMALIARAFEKQETRTHGARDHRDR